MSFKCQKCDVPQDPGTKPNRVVVARYRNFKNSRLSGQIKREENHCAPCIMYYSSNSSRLN